MDRRRQGAGDRCAAGDREGKLVSPWRRRRRVVTILQQRRGLSQRRTCQITGQHRFTQRHPLAEPDADRDLRTRLRQFAGNHPRWGYRRAHAVLGRGGLCGQPEEDPTALVGRGPARARQTAPAPAPGRVCPARRAHGSSVCAVDTPYCAGTGSALRRRRRCSPLHPHQHLEAGQPEQQSAMAARRGGELPIRQLPTDLINYRKMVRVAVRIHITVIFRASVAVLARRLFPAPRESAAPVGGQTRQ